MYSNVKSLWPNPTSRDHDLNKLESTLPDDTSTQVTDFLAIRFLIKDTLKIQEVFNNLLLSLLERERDPSFQQN